MKAGDQVIAFYKKRNVVYIIEHILTSSRVSPVARVRTLETGESFLRTLANLEPTSETKEINKHTNPNTAFRISKWNVVYKIT